ncbi:BCCT family transporter [Peptococcus simiae]|uniref:BCCT family transporter n=1 Tax=Peptococcus simiae TaxID=1643805 RepID=A0ABW9H0I8_9FIRM
MSRKNDTERIPQRGVAKVNKFVIAFSLIIVACFYGPMMVFQEDLQGLADDLYNLLTFSTDWFWQIAVVACIIFSIFLIFSKYGDIKLGGPEAEPEFTTFQWFALLFCGGSGAGLLYWGVLEPINYIAAPPFGLEPMSAEAAQFGEAYGIFHWGISSWATFVIPAVGFAYMTYVRRQPYLYPSYACRDVLGKKATDGIIGRVIDAIVIIGMVGGVGTTLATFLPMICDLGTSYLGIPRTLATDLVFVAAFGCMFGYSCYRGLYSGLSKISDLNMYGIILMLLVLFILGPTSFLLSQYADSLGVLFQNFIRMSLYTDPITKSGFPQSWTVFYWAWWYAWAMYMGLFVARISKGRKIRTLVLNMLLTTTLGCSIYYMTFGGHTINLIMNKNIDLPAMLESQGGVATITYVLNQMPLAKIVVPLLVIVMLISQVTAVDSVAFTMAQMCCDRIDDGQEPPKWTRILMAVTLVLCVFGLLLVGGQRIVQLSSIMTSFPVVFIEAIIAVSLLKWFKTDFQLPKAAQLKKIVHYDEKGVGIARVANLSFEEQDANQQTDNAVSSQVHSRGAITK